MAAWRPAYWIGSKSLGTSEFIRALHDHWVFCGEEADWCQRASVLASTGDDFLLEGPVGSGKRELAQALAQFKGAKLVSLDCIDDDESQIENYFEQPMGDFVVFINNIEEATGPLQKRFLKIPIQRRVGKPLVILAFQPKLGMDRTKQQFLRKLESGFRHHRLVLPPLKKRGWDIPALVASFLYDTGVEYITYNCLDFLTWYDWPDNIYGFEKMMRFLIASIGADAGESVVTLSHIRNYFPSIDLKDDGILSINLETAEISSRNDETGEIIVWPENYTTIEYRRNHVFRWISYGPGRPGPNLKNWKRRLILPKSWLEWVSNEDREECLEVDAVSFDRTEHVLFDLEKMWERYKDILPTQATMTATPHGDRIVSRQIERDRGYDKFLALAKTTIVTSSDGYDDHTMRNPLHRAWDALKLDPSMSILLTGESGTGKELFARVIHQSSSRKSRPFIPVNCAAIPNALIESRLFGHEKGAFTDATDRKTGKFQDADGGMLFLDEIGDMSDQVQAKILRVLEDGEIDVVGGSTPLKVDVRILAATNKDLALEMEEGRFRQDLYYRIATFPINIPPLRKRFEDIPGLLAKFWLDNKRSADRVFMYIESTVIGFLLTHEWPGNIRELKGVVGRACASVHSEMWSVGDVEGYPPPGFHEGNLAGNKIYQRLEFCLEQSQDVGSRLNMEKLCEAINVDASATEGEPAADDTVFRIPENDKDEIMRCLKKTKGNIARTAELTGHDRKTVRKVRDNKNKMK